MSSVVASVCCHSESVRELLELLQPLLCATVRQLEVETMQHRVHGSWWQDRLSVWTSPQSVSLGRSPLHPDVSV